MILHATTLDFKGYGVLLSGASGSGKSGLGLQLMALGMRLVSDDCTVLEKQGQTIVASSPEATVGMIEARGLGLLNADSVSSTQVRLFVDLDHIEKDRFPPVRSRELLGSQIPCLRKVDAAYFPAAILQYVLAGRREPS